LSTARERYVPRPKRDQRPAPARGGLSSWRCGSAPPSSSRFRGRQRAAPPPPNQPNSLVRHRPPVSRCRLSFKEQSGSSAAARTSAGSGRTDSCRPAAACRLLSPVACAGDRLGGGAVALWLTLAVWAVLELGLRVRERLGGKGSTARDRGTRALAAVTLGIAVAVAVVTASRSTGPEIAGPYRSLGVIVMWLGLAIRVWAIAALGRAFRTTVEVDSGQTVVSSGPYRWVRHPSYSGLLLIVTGCGLAAGTGLRWPSAPCYRCRRCCGASRSRKPVDRRPRRPLPRLPGADQASDPRPMVIEQRPFRRDRGRGHSRC
jgi:protein-S-isoprenylcysteine O-methyltransferase Ste14